MLVSAQRNTIAAAMSAGVQARWSKERSIAACLRSAGHGRAQWLPTTPGATAWAGAAGARAGAGFCVRWIGRALLPPEAVRGPAILRPAPEAVLQPAPPAALSAAAAA